MTTGTYESRQAFEEISALEEDIGQFTAGRLSADELRPRRTLMGVYGQRQKDRYMLRARVPLGILDAEQLEALGEVARLYSRGFGYVTTRQDVQFHFMPLEHIIPALRRLDAARISTREAGGNIVRNVTCDPLAGVCRESVFDVTPYARAISEHFLRNPDTQALPRKVKIAVSGCPRDHAATSIHDIGAIATERSGARGFQVVVGGGLGTVPRLADVLEEFVPAQELVRTCDAVLRVFNKLGDRKTRVRSRLKFLVARVGIDAFRELVREELRRMPPVTSGLYATPREWEAEVAPDRGRTGVAYAAPDEDDFWRRSNVVAQRQEPYYSVEVALPIGAVTAQQLAVLAQAARGFADGSLRTTIRQNMLLRWVHEDDLASLHATLAAYGLAKPVAGTVLDPVGCPGAETCSSAITNGKGLARAIVAELGETGWLHARAHINVSGCPNACGQHYLGDIGLAGCAMHVNGRLLPTYQLFVKGAGSPLGEPVERLAAKQVPGAIHALLEAYEAERAPGEGVRDFLTRIGADGVRRLLADHARLPGFEEEPMAYVDWGMNKLFSLDERGEGECSV
jgi:sulfite reductase beta subunit-like hemoprotein